MIRTIPFMQIFNRIVRKTGGDPKNVVRSQTGYNIIEDINHNVEVACQSWDWPEWRVTEERAFRSIWNRNRQFHIAGENGQPDEFYYIGDPYQPPTAFKDAVTGGANKGYYRVLSTAVHNPPVGTIPTDTTYFEPFTIVDTFIAYDQICKRSIGMVLGVYRENPRILTRSQHGAMRFMPSERGIDVPYCGAQTVFITFKLRVPTFTVMPYLPGRTYYRDDVVLDPDSQECFQALTTTTQPPTTIDWTFVPFLAKWEHFVVHASYADSLMKFTTPAETQIKMALAESLNQDAMDLLQLEVDVLRTQGQTLQYQHFYRNRTYNCWCESQTFNGGTVSTLTDQCEADLGWVRPTQPASPNLALLYANDVVAILTADGTPSLQQFATIGLAVGSVMDIIVDVDGQPSALRYRLDGGPADSGDVGQVAPDDFDAGTNNKHWIKVAGA